MSAYLKMDPNGNIPHNFDGSFNLSGIGSLNGSGSFSGSMQNVPNLQTYTPDQLLQLQQLNQQRILQIQEQLSQMQLAGSTNIGQFSQISTTTPMAVAGGTLYSPNTPNSPVVNPHFMPVFPVTNSVGLNSPVAGSFPANSIISINGQVPATLYNNLPSTGYNQMTYHNSLAGMNSSLSNQIHVQVPNQSGQFAGQSRYAPAPSSLQLQHVNTPRGASLSNSNYSSSASSTPQDSPGISKRTQQGVNDYSDGPTFMQRPRQMVTSPPSVRPPPTSDRSSTSSSIPGSPSSSGNPPFSPDGSLSDSFGPISPDGTPKKGINGDVKSPGAQIKNKPLQIETRHPQDKCYACMKKVYPMEKLGPVRGVVFHKICFKCNSCHTTLNMQNFFHNQSDQFDKTVYCKSHQPIVTDKGAKLDAESIEIKSALSAPKKGAIIPETERVPVHKYSYDVTSQEIDHARKAPVADLQSGVKARNHAWSKSKREHYNSPSTMVVKYDEQVPEYNQEEYNRHIIESEPDYY